MKQESVILKNVTKGVTVGTRVMVADTCLRRLVGLLGRTELDTGCGLLIKPSSGVHTYGMLFAIDVVAFDKKMRVMKLWRKLGPFRLTGIDLKIDSIVELPVETIDGCRIELGDRFEI